MTPLQPTNLLLRRFVVNAKTVRHFDNIAIDSSQQCTCECRCGGLVGWRLSVSSRHPKSALTVAFERKRERLAKRGTNR